MFRGSYTAGSVAFLLLSTTLPAFCLRIFPRNARKRKVGGTALAPGLLHTKPSRLPSRKPGRFVCFRGAFSGAHAKSCEGSFGKPRVCGERLKPVEGELNKEGSPPRMRGKVDVGDGVDALAGITPAYAGKRVHHDTRTSRCKDHPRACGEKTVPPSMVMVGAGSTPRMRGKGHLTLAVSHMHRITPAYAGKSRVHGASSCGEKDHPRVCGEKTKKIP